MKADRDRNDNAPVALILGAAVWEGGPSPTLRRRSLRAVDLWRSGQARAFVACGGLGRWPPSEARAIADILRAEGVPEAVLHLEDRSTSTWENLAFALPILDALGCRRVWIVTDGYHMRRARMIGRAMGLDTLPAIAPSGRGNRGMALRQALREVPATLSYAARIAMARAGKKG